MNQETYNKAQALVQNEIFVNASRMIDALLKAEDQETTDALYGSLTHECEACNGDGYDDEGEDCTECEGEGHITLEPLEFWAVTSRLSGKLSEWGGCTFECHGLDIWGRTTSGQAIAMDYIIQEIADN